MGVYRRDSRRNHYRSNYRYFNDVNSLANIFNLNFCKTSFVFEMEKSTDSRNSINLLGVRVNNLDVGTLNSRILEDINKGSHAVYPSVNALALNLAYENTWLQDFYNSSEVVFCDGAGVILGARLLGYKIVERITYAEWTWHLAEFASSHGLSFYFLGAKPGIAEKAAARLKDRYKNLKILGFHHGYFDKDPGSDENARVIQKINAIRPDILIVAFGMPLQEQWLKENWDRIDAFVALTGGAVFDYISGELRRPPRLLTDHGMEWLGRMSIEPQRLWKRYIIGNPLFLLRILKQKNTKTSE